MHVHDDHQQQQGLQKLQLYGLAAPRYTLYATCSPQECAEELQKHITT